ncbi:hypothetical protein GDO81_029569 [Engystomops pustulosus]|uniref:Secreted protein n=1 Tax=Engystomops pustulosus TaxID=76066 RepID=A0AAV6ZF93_ENGPU|nr:hypothetical protein GDO81_029569 [Engystomops pustulosus]
MELLIVCCQVTSRETRGAWIFLLLWLLSLARPPFSPILSRLSVKLASPLHESVQIHPAGRNVKHNLLTRPIPRQGILET